jgi:hypothetical protein
VYESRFLGKCIDGGHTGCGHRRRVVGNEDFLRRVSKQVTGVEQETSVQEGVRDKGKATLPRRRKLSFPNARKVSPADAALSAQFALRTAYSGIRFQALMHFSAYLMIAALVLLGLQLAYAFYQLATFIL